MKFVHQMLVPVDAQDSEDNGEHGRHSFDLIDRGVILGEDERISEATRRGLATGANTRLAWPSTAPWIVRWPSQIWRWTPLGGHHREMKLLRGIATGRFERLDFHPQGTDRRHRGKHRT